MKFQKSGDQDGFIGDFSAKTKLTTETYQLKVKTEPGAALFEVSITYDIKKNSFVTKVSLLYLYYLYYIYFTIYKYQ